MDTKFFNIRLRCNVPHNRESITHRRKELSELSFIEHDAGFWVPSGECICLFTPIQQLAHFTSCLLLKSASHHVILEPVVLTL